MSEGTVLGGILLGGRSGGNVRRCERKEPTSVLHDALAERCGIVPADLGEPSEGVRAPGRFVAMSAVRHRREEWAIAFDEQAILGDHPQEVEIVPLLKGDDPTEGAVPPDVERRLGEGCGSAEAVQDATDTSPSGLTYHRDRIIDRLTGMDDHGARGALRDSELVGEGAALLDAWRVIVVVIESTLPHGHRPLVHGGLERGAITARVVVGGIVGMDPSGPPDLTGMRSGHLLRSGRGLERFPDADHPTPSRIAEPLEDPLTIRIERFAGEVRMRVDEWDGGERRGPDAVLAPGPRPTRLRSGHAFAARA